MSYMLDWSLSLGTGKAGLSDLRAQLVDTSGGAVGAAVSTGFTEIGSGCYLWHCATIPDGHRGGVAFYSAATPAMILAFGAINPEEAERVDAAVSSRATQTGVDDLPTNAELATALAGADDAVLAAIAALNNLSSAGAQAAAAAALAAYGVALEATAQSILEDTGTTLPATLAMLGPGVGAHTLTYTLTDSVSLLPVADALVEISTDSAKANVIRSGRTDSLGGVLFHLSAAGTYYVWRTKDGYVGTEPDIAVVA